LCEGAAGQAVLGLVATGLLAAALALANHTHGLGLSAARGRGGLQMRLMSSAAGPDLQPAARVLVLTCSQQPGCWS
jgi:hypothetical protein